MPPKRALTCSFALPGSVWLCRLLSGSSGPIRVPPRYTRLCIAFSMGPGSRRRLRSVIVGRYLAPDACGPCRPTCRGARPGRQLGGFDPDRAAGAQPETLRGRADAGTVRERRGRVPAPAGGLVVPLRSPSAGRARWRRRTAGRPTEPWPHRVTRLSLTSSRFLFTAGPASRAASRQLVIAWLYFGNRRSSRSRCGESAGAAPML